MRRENTDLTIRRRCCVASEALPPFWLDSDTSPILSFSRSPVMALSMLLLYVDGTALGKAEGKNAFVVTDDDEEELWDSGDSYCTAGNPWREVNIAAGLQQRWEGQKKKSSLFLSTKKKQKKKICGRYLI